MKAYLRGLSDEFGESTNSIRLELNHLEEAGLLKSESEGNKKVYQANLQHPLFEDIHHLVMKHSGIAQIIEKVILQVGDVEKVWIRGDFALGKDCEVIELVIMGSDINSDYFESLVKKAKELIRREVKYLIIPSGKYPEFISATEKTLLIWEK